ncbi:MAG: DUF3365 domain-containing protein [Hyphomicrobiaceae bacterium]
MSRGRKRQATIAAILLLVGPALAIAQGSSGSGASPPPAGETSTIKETGAIDRPVKTDVDKLVEAARQTVRRFKERMKGELAAAIKSDGAANAVSLCQTIAPDISTEFTDSSGFEVMRTSFKLRNPENAPGTWERDVLADFQEKAAAGADPNTLERFDEIETPEGDKLFRYMSGISTGEICLNCHGSEIKPDVKAELVRYYPDDKATGYRLGELRGAFSLVKLLTE